jgi:hypothetical protein
MFISGCSPALCGYFIRDVAQPGSVLRSGRRGRWFESSHPDFKGLVLAGPFILYYLLGNCLIILQQLLKYFFLQRISNSFFQRILYIIQIKICCINSDIRKFFF